MNLALNAHRTVPRGSARYVLLAVLGLLGYGFHRSPQFMEIAAGVAVFLFGMMSLERGFRSFTGGLLERLLYRCTNALYKSITFGIVTTSLMQSSSLVSIIAISFLSTGMIGLQAGLGIIFGANIGTTTGAWLVAGIGLKVKISAFAMPMLVFGIILVFQRGKAFKGAGYILAGLGFLFLGIHFMKEGFESFKSTIDLATYALPGIRGLVVFTLIGAAATVIMQSSHASLVLVITALAAGQITYENALALAIGANIGTTVTALIGAMTASVEGKRLAAGHLIFNVATGAIAIALIQPFTAAVGHISDWVGIAADDHSLRLAVFHTLFNSVGVIVMTPWINRLVRLLQWMLPVKEPEVTRPLYLNEASAQFAETALEAVRNEADHLFDNAFVLLAHGIDLHRAEILSDRDLSVVVAPRRDPIPIEFDADYERTVKVLYAAIVEFVTKVPADLTPEQRERLHQHRVAARHIVEAVKSVKHLRKNLIVYIASENTHIRRAYNDLRVTLGNVMREVAALREVVKLGGKIELSRLDQLRSEVKNADVLASGTLDELIRTDLISGKMASSLMNDSSYTFYAVNHMVAMAESLYEPPERLAAISRELDEAAIGDTAEMQPAQVRYLHLANSEQAGAAEDAIRKEVTHLYERALDILSWAIGLEPGSLHDDADLPSLFESRGAPPHFPMDLHYEKKIKVLYAAITDFVSKAQAHVPPGERNALLALRMAAREVVEAVKCAKHLRKNLTVHLASRNAHIRRAYVDICVLLGSVMRGLARAQRARAEGKLAAADFSELEALVRVADVLADGTLDDLVQGNLVTPWMATSLMNDSAYAQHACTHLIRAAECVFAPARQAKVAGRVSS